MADKPNPRPIDPDRQPLTALQATRLAALSGVPAKELVSKNVAQLAEALKWRIDPELFLFRKVCGRVVKRDPVSGTEYPVPFATVHAEDTDCSLLGLFPVESPWSWFFPILCKREEIATAKTDACGRFCIYIPRFEIDWILRFRRDRICFPIIFLRPTVRDLLEVLVEPPRVRRPPLPDPPPILKDGGLGLRRVEQVLGPGVANRLVAMEIGASFGQDTTERERLLESPAFRQPLRPPLPAEFRQAQPQTSRGLKRREAVMQPVRSTLASRLRLSPELLAHLDFDRVVGPFRRCYDIFFPEWVPILDVPDVTFRVTQDVNSDGTEEVIYSEGFFDVRWNAGAIPDVTLEALPSAIAGNVCDTPPIPCADSPAILFAGLHPVKDNDPPADPYFDADTGYAIRVNRPHPSGLISDALPHPAATAPMHGTLQIYGCNRVKNATHYRVRYTYGGGSSVPFTGLSWPLYRVVGGVLQTMWPAADADGWYPVLPQTDGWFPDLLLVEWSTVGFANGLYVLELDTRDAANVVTTSVKVGIYVDNQAPGAYYTRFRWRKAGALAWSELPLTCAVINRGAPPADIQMEISYSVSATHLRQVQLSGGGCGGGVPVLSSAAATAEHWYTGELDNSVTNTAIFDLPAAGSPAGAYGFNLYATSRAFNPSGGDGGHLADWNYDNPWPIYVIPYLPVSIVDV